MSLSNLDKVLYPETGTTKGEAIDYYARIAPVMVPHLAGRCITLKRFPNGVEKTGFFEKRCPKHRPAWIPTAPLTLPTEISALQARIRARFRSSSASQFAHLNPKVMGSA